MKSFVAIAVVLFVLLLLALGVRRYREMQRELSAFEECQRQAGCVWQ